jgi:hypothetical protein
MNCGQQQQQAGWFVLCTSLCCNSSEATVERRNKALRAGRSSALRGRSGVHLAKSACYAFPQALLESLGVMLCQFLSGVTCVCNKFTNSDGNWPDLHSGASLVEVEGACLAARRGSPSQPTAGSGPGSDLSLRGGLMPPRSTVRVKPLSHSAPRELLWPTDVKPLGVEQSPVPTFQWS